MFLFSPCVLKAKNVFALFALKVSRKQRERAVKVISRVGLSSCPETSLSRRHSPPGVC